MSDFRNEVLVGNVVLYPEIIRQFLIKSHYFLTYDPKENKLTLNANHGGGGLVLFEIRNIPYESAAKLAEGLGLIGDGESPLEWSKWNPILSLHHDCSEDAETLRMEMLRLGIPHITYNASTVLSLEDGQYTYNSPDWTIPQMLEIIQKTAERCKEQLATTP